ncbi:MAG TPA: OFA family MFS transporter [Amycolatopsis sp.]|nr:OFA family MFS transporter [Amycolatopsis sp.]
MTAATYQEIVDENGRTYRIGESARDIMGRSRSWMVWLPWVAMMAVSVFEYGWGAVVGTLEDKYHWTLGDVFWLASIWAVFQAGVAFPAGRLRERNVVSAKTAMLAGAVLSGIGYFTIAHSGSLLVAFIGYSVLGGTGAGLVYAPCINMVGKWYPEKRGARTGFVNGGFAYGSVPFIYIFSAYLTHQNTTIVLDLIGLYMLIAVAVCGFLFKDPPKNWWPATVDPITWARGKSGVKSLAKNPPAVRQFTPMEAIRTGMLPLMWVCLVIIGGVSLFMVFAFLSGFGGGAFYPLFAALVPDYFGENNNASNYGLVYSAKLVGGVGGGGLAAGVVSVWGYTGAYILAGSIALLSAVLTLFLRQPGRARPLSVQPDVVAQPTAATGG